jgi:hypothetical protein
MTIDFSQPLKGIDEKGAIVTLTEKGPDQVVRPVTLAVVAYSALLRPDEKAADAEKMTRYKLAFQIAQASGPVELSLDDAAMVKRLIGQNPSPLVVGQAFEMLEAPKPSSTQA